MNFVTALPTRMIRPTADFMARHAGINSGHHGMPLIAHLMKVRMANSTKQNFDLDVLRPWSATLVDAGARPEFALRAKKHSW